MFNTRNTLRARTQTSTRSACPHTVILHMQYVFLFLPVFISSLLFAYPSSNFQLSRHAPPCFRQLMSILSSVYGLYGLARFFLFRSLDLFLSSNRERDRHPLVGGSVVRLIRIIIILKITVIIIVAIRIMS